MLSPLSWWNDLVFNIPISYFAALPFKLIDEKLFFPAFIACYWLSNALGFVLMQFGIAGLKNGACPVTKKSIAKTFAITCLYSLLMVILIKSEIFKLPTETIQAFLNN